MKERKKWSKGKIRRLLQIIPICLCVILAVCVAASGREITAETILDYSPENPVLAALVLIALYAVKSLSVVLPLMPIQVAGGFLFSPVTAVLVNTAGMAVSLTAAYWVGRMSGMEFVSAYVQKYPKLEHIVGLQHENSFFVAFFLRVIRCLPLDVVSMYLGATGMRYGTYLLAGLLGTMPGTIMSTLIGTSITDPSSPMFIISVVVTAALSAGSLLLYRWWKKRLEQ